MVLVGILKGVVYFFSDLSRLITIPHSCYFIEASSYHNGQTSGTLSIMGSIEPSKFAGKNVVLLDELYDNGHTMEQIKQAIHEKASVPLDLIYTYTLFKKNKQTEKTPDLFGAPVPDVWLVGYGLDDRQEKRNWPVLYACPKIDGIPKTADDQIFEDVQSYNQMRTNLLRALE